jgi:hypothetical protein
VSRPGTPRTAEAGTDGTRDQLPLTCLFHAQATSRLHRRLLPANFRITTLEDFEEGGGALPTAVDVQSFVGDAEGVLSQLVIGQPRSACSISSGAGDEKRRRARTTRSTPTCSA